MDSKKTDIGLLPIDKTSDGKICGWHKPFTVFSHSFHGLVVHYERGKHGSNSFQAYFQITDSKSAYKEVNPYLFKAASEAKPLMNDDFYAFTNQNDDIKQPRYLIRADVTYKVIIRWKKNLSNCFSI